MFFIMGIDPRHKQLQYNNSVFICDRCGNQTGTFKTNWTNFKFELQAL